MKEIIIDDSTELQSQKNADPNKIPNNRPMKEIIIDDSTELQKRSNPADLTNASETKKSRLSEEKENRRYTNITQHLNSPKTWIFIAAALLAAAAIIVAAISAEDNRNLPIGISGIETEEPTEKQESEPESKDNAYDYFFGDQNIPDDSSTNLPENQIEFENEMPEMPQFPSEQEIMDEFNIDFPDIKELAPPEMPQFPDW